MSFEDFEELPKDELFTDESDLKRKIVKLERQLVKFRDEQSKDTKRLVKQQEKALLNTVEFYEGQIDALREQNRELFEKNLELHETSKLFLKGLEHLKNDGVRVMLTHNWSRKGIHGSLENRINTLVLSGKRIISVCPTRVDSHGYTDEALIITEHTDKRKV